MNRLRMVVSESVRSLSSNLSTTVAATMTVLIAMFLLGLFIALGTWALAFSDQAKERLLTKVYMCAPVTCKQGEVTGQQLNETRAFLLNLPEVKSVRFVSKEEALAIMKRRTPEIVQSLPSNPLPHAFQVAPKRPEDVKALSEKIARALGNALVAPVLAYVPEGRLAPPDGHMRFPGTITVPNDVFEKTLESAARSLALHGFRDVVFLGDHGGAQADQRAVAARLNREWTKGASRAHAIDEYYRASQVEFPQLLKARGYRQDELGSHAGLADTSLMLAIDPRLVRTSQMKPGRREDGVDGDPSRASAELGRLGEELIVPRTVEAIKKATTRP